MTWQKNGNKDKKVYISKWLTTQDTRVRSHKVDQIVDFHFLLDIRENDMIALDTLSL